MDQAKASTQGIGFDIEMDPQLDPDHSFRALVGMNLYRIIQESVNNSLKYAQPKNISLRFDKTSAGFQVVIADDGTGFDEQQITPGNGLSNMRKRARELQGDLTITSAVGKGTQVVLVLDEQ